jgi:hypothetical protein
MKKRKCFVYDFLSININYAKPDTMKKSKLIFAAVFSSSVQNIYAATGSAKDGYLFAFFLIGILLLFAGVLYLTDFFKKKGKHLFDKMISHKHALHKKGNDESFQPPEDDPKNYFKYSY